MDWIDLQKKIKLNLDHSLSDRAIKNLTLSKVLNGTMYDCLNHSYYNEMSGGEYIPLDKRRPSVNTGTSLLVKVVEDIVSLLFDDEHFPNIHANDITTRDKLVDIIKDSNLKGIMIESALKGSVGSVAIKFSLLRNRVFFNVLNTTFLTPFYDPEEPDTLLKVVEQYKISGEDLNRIGYDLDGSFNYWFIREYNKEEEIIYKPIKVHPDIKITFTKDKVVNHNLGFCPVVWIKNLPNGYSPIDGASTFESGISTAIEMDYQISQGGRALKYAGDPKLVIKTDDKEALIGMGSGSKNALIVPQDSDTKYLEINGTAASSILDYNEKLRASLLETIHGNRTNADKMSSAQSGRAMEMMNQDLIWQTSKLRISYGNALLNLLKMICKISNIPNVFIKIDDEKITGLNSKGLTLVWPNWYTLTAQEKQLEVNAICQAYDSKIISKHTAIKNIANIYEIEDIEAEYLLLEKEEKEEQIKDNKKNNVDIKENNK